jgi:hypothetical protein
MKKFIKELKAKGLEKFNWYVLKPIAVLLCLYVVLTF